MRFFKTTVSVAPASMLAAGLMIGSGVSASTEPVHHARTARHHGRHVVRVLPAPHGYIGPVIDNESYLYGPRYRNGADDDLSTDGAAIGREGDLVQRDGAPKGYRGPGLELEGPPIYPSLPVVPELYDPDLR